MYSAYHSVSTATAKEAPNATLTTVHPGLRLRPSTTLRLLVFRADGPIANRPKKDGRLHRNVGPFGRQHPQG